MAKPTKTPTGAETFIRVSILLPAADCAWIDAEAMRLSAAESYGRTLTRSDVIRSILHTAATAATKKKGTTK